MVVCQLVGESSMCMSIQHCFLELDQNLFDALSILLHMLTDPDIHVTIRRIVCPTSLETLLPIMSHCSKNEELLTSTIVTMTGRHCLTSRRQCHSLKMVRLEMRFTRRSRDIQIFSFPNLPFIIDHSLDPPHHPPPSASVPSPPSPAPRSNSAVPQHPYSPQ